MSKNILILAVLFFSIQSLAKPWNDHLEDIGELERNIYKFQQELDVLVEKKKNTRERARIEQTLQRIVEIHAELISLRRKMDNTREHLKAEHPEKAHILDDYDSRMFSGKTKGRSRNTKLAHGLDDLLMKVQLKYSSFLLNQEKEEIAEVDKIIQIKQKRKKEREADLYLRKRSKIRLVE